jgi:endonuclease/exonuclease/phosphatase family metal-dependent hydrolase
MKILTQNIWTPLVGSENDIMRIDTFASAVTNYDVIMVQEVFIFTMFCLRLWGHDLYLETKLRENGFQYFLKGKKASWMQNNGLFVASKYPLELISELNFPDREDDEMFTRKGALIFKIKESEFRKDPVFINTHLHCGDGNPLYEKIRFNQLMQISKELYAKNITSDIILGGDLNINGLSGNRSNEREYRNLVGIYGTMHDPLRLTDYVTCPPDARLDYLLLINNDYLWFENPNVVILGQSDDLPNGISDHYGVEVDLVSCDSFS